MREHQSYGGAAFLSGMDGRDEVRELRIFKSSGWEGERRKSWRSPESSHVISRGWRQAAVMARGGAIRCHVGTLLSVFSFLQKKDACGSLFGPCVIDRSIAVEKVFGRDREHRGMWVFRAWAGVRPRFCHVFGLTFVNLQAELVQAGL